MPLVDAMSTIALGAYTVPRTSMIDVPVVTSTVCVPACHTSTPRYGPDVAGVAVNDAPGCTVNAPPAVCSNTPEPDTTAPAANVNPLQNTCRPAWNVTAPEIVTAFGYTVAVSAPVLDPSVGFVPVVHAAGATIIDNGSGTSASSAVVPVTTYRDTSPPIGVAPHELSTTRSPSTCVERVPDCDNVGHVADPNTTSGVSAAFDVVTVACSSARRLARSDSSNGAAASPPVIDIATESGNPEHPAG